MLHLNLKVVSVVKTQQLHFTAIMITLLVNLEAGCARIVTKVLGS